MMFAEFAHVPNESFLPKDGSFEISEGWYGDVKYHKGATYPLTIRINVKISL